MSPVTVIARIVGIVLPLLAGCQAGNPSTGNDAEAALDPPARAAPHRSAAEALAGVALEDVQPQTMSDADLASLGGDASCRFRLTRPAWPSFVYVPRASQGTIKLNGALVTLPRVREGVFADGGLRVSLRPVGDADAHAAMQAAELIVLLPHTAQELGFRGYVECPPGAVSAAAR